MCDRIEDGASDNNVGIKLYKIPKSILSTKLSSTANTIFYYIIRANKKYISIEREIKASEAKKHFCRDPSCRLGKISFWAITFFFPFHFGLRKKRKIKGCAFFIGATWGVVKPVGLLLLLEPPFFLKKEENNVEREREVKRGTDSLDGRTSGRDCSVVNIRSKILCIYVSIYTYMHL